ncbi:MAG: M23 family metallopeptidase [Firmicutes bacterium]|nr:M23 family metallopeptidase [Bacillota bacterium]
MFSNKARSLFLSQSKRLILCLLLLFLLFTAVCRLFPHENLTSANAVANENNADNSLNNEIKEPPKEKPNFIRWVDFNASAEIMRQAYRLDQTSINSEIHLNFIDSLAYVAFKNGNKFNYEKDIKILNDLVIRLRNGEKIENITNNNKYFKYYHEAYSAIFAGFIGHYEQNGTKNYGLIAYNPIAKGFHYHGSSDFGTSRSFGFKRVHLGHDMFGSLGTPVIAVEGGTVTEFGWNRYGGWRIGIRSQDQKRYYYYAHLRKDKPFAQNISKGSEVKAGQVIGYLGATGYSYKENVNMKTNPHLHFGMQLIFDKSQEDGNGEIWIDVYQIVKFLSQNRAETVRNDNGHRESVNLREVRIVI